MLKQFTLFSAAAIMSLPSVAADTYNIDKATGIITTPDTTYQLGPNVLMLSADESGSPYIYSDPIKAFDAVNSAGKSVTLLATPSVYWLDNPDDPTVRKDPGGTPYAVRIQCDTLRIIGLADNPEDIVFAVNRGQTQGALGNYTMFHFKGRSLETANITYGNYCNLDLVYPRDPSFNREKRREAIVQAQIGICENSDRFFADNCRFLSRLNLCPFIGARRSLYNGCYFECTDDALTGSAIYVDCDFTFYSGKPLYSAPETGAIFLDCDFHTLVNGTQYLTKAPGMVTIIDGRFTSDNPVTLQWTRDASPVRCFQSNITLNGTPVTIDANRRDLGPDISGTPLLKAYKIVDNGTTVYNIPNLTAGDDGWDPLGMRGKIEEIEKRTGTQLLGLPVALRVSTSAKKIEAEDDRLDLTPMLLLWGEYPAAAPKSVRWTAPTTLKLEQSNGISTAAVSANTFPREITATITASTSDGLIGATDITIGAKLKNAPELTSSPVIEIEKSNLKLKYGLTADGTDDSNITWYRATRQDLSDSIAVRQGHGTSASIYPLSGADKGCYLAAKIEPKLTDSKYGEPVIARLDNKMLAGPSKKESRLTTSFAEVPIRRNSAGIKGTWHFDTYKPVDTEAHDWTPDPNLSWYYGPGVDATTGIGLVQATRGARLSYTPFRDKCKDMILSVIAEPAKGPGQGFGSATGQYMDLCIKFNPVTLTGYALRIERTPDYDKAVTFTLVRYDNGKVTPISEPVASNCFRNPCYINVEIRNNVMTAIARTEAEASPSSNPAVKSHVFVSAPVSPSEDCSFAVQHTGTIGPGATLLRNLDVTWK